ncbi:uncharacterized protein LOC117577539 [Drosophila albomicans]|uniref:Uncharacterized protein LOC117577539 n=1 Tax=Drosophila albomicans TaxID=7291 RepID=A0A6P8XXQ7_DROAB|nr:uncharacterized protein LOC117577539 [Drosophila albomicans]
MPAFHIVVKLLMLRLLLANLSGLSPGSLVCAGYDFGYHPSAEEFDSLLRETRTWTRDLLANGQHRETFVPRFQRRHELSPHKSELDFQLFSDVDQEQQEQQQQPFAVFESVPELEIPTTHVQSQLIEIQDQPQHATTATATSTTSTSPGNASFPIFFTNPATGIVYAISEVSKSHSQLPNGSNDSDGIAIYVTKQQYDADLQALRHKYEQQCASPAQSVPAQSVISSSTSSVSKKPATLTTARPQIIRLQKPKKTPGTAAGNNKLPPHKPPPVMVSSGHISDQLKLPTSTARPQRQPSRTPKPKRGKRKKKKKPAKRRPGHKLTVSTTAGPQIVLGKRTTSRPPTASLSLATQLEKPHMPPQPTATIAAGTIFNEQPFVVSSGYIEVPHQRQRRALASQPETVAARPISSGKKRPGNNRRRPSSGGGGGSRGTGGGGGRGKPQQATPTKPALSQQNGESGYRIPVAVHLLHNKHKGSEEDEHGTVPRIGEEPAKLHSEEHYKLLPKEPPKLHSDESYKLYPLEHTKPNSEESSKLPAQEHSKLHSEERSKLTLQEHTKLISDEPAKLEGAKPPKLHSEDPSVLHSEEPSKLHSEERSKLRSKFTARRNSAESDFDLFDLFTGADYEDDDDTYYDQEEKKHIKLIKRLANRRKGSTSKPQQEEIDSSSAEEGADFGAMEEEDPSKGDNNKHNISSSSKSNTTAAPVTQSAEKTSSEEQEQQSSEEQDQHSSEDQTETHSNTKQSSSKKRIKRRPAGASEEYEYDDDDDDEDSESDSESGISSFFRMIFYPVQVAMSRIFDGFTGQSEEQSAEASAKPKYPTITLYHSTAHSNNDLAIDEDEEEDEDDRVDESSSLSSWFSYLFGLGRRTKKIGSTTTASPTAAAPAPLEAPPSEPSGWLESWFGFGKTTTQASSEEDDYDKWFSSWFEGTAKPKARRRKTTTSTTSTTSTTTTMPQMPILTIVDPLRNPQNWIGILAHHIANATGGGGVGTAATTSTTHNPLLQALVSRATSTTTPQPDVPRRISYEKYQIWRLKPQDEGQVLALEEFKKGEDGNKMQWLKGPSLRGLTDVLVPPKMLVDFQGTLNFENIAHEVLIFDVGKAIAYERTKEQYLYTTPPATRRPTKHPVTAPAMSWNKYHEHDDILKYLETMRMRHAQLLELIHIGRSYEGRPLIVVKIESKQTAAAATAAAAASYKRPKHKRRSGQANAVFIEAGSQGLAWIGPASATWMIGELLRMMRTNKTDVEHEFIRNTTWYIMPVLNPDGYVYSHEYDRFWKKSRSQHVAKPSGGLLDTAMTWLQQKQAKEKVCYGVDLDRNWMHQWGKRGSSKGPCNEFYAGPAPFSEPETKAVSEFLMDYRTQIKLFVSLQAYGQVVSYPVKANSTFNAERLDDFLDVAMVGVDGLRKKGSKSRYKVDSANDLIEQRSGCADAFAAYEIGIPFSYTLQLADNGVHGYLLPSSAIEPTARDAFEIIKGMLDYI